MAVGQAGNLGRGFAATHWGKEEEEEGGKGKGKRKNDENVPPVAPPPPPQKRKRGSTNDHRNITFNFEHHTRPAIIPSHNPQP